MITDLQNPAVSLQDYGGKKHMLLMVIGLAAPLPEGARVKLVRTCAPAAAVCVCGVCV